MEEQRLYLNSDLKMGERTYDGVYDLSGRKVQPQSKGLYIKNGKKVYIK